MAGPGSPADIACTTGLPRVMDVKRLYRIHLPWEAWDCQAQRWKFVEKGNRLLNGTSSRDASRCSDPGTNGQSNQFSMLQLRCIRFLVQLVKQRKWLDRRFGGVSPAPSRLGCEQAHRTPRPTREFSSDLKICTITICDWKRRRFVTRSNQYNTKRDFSSVALRTQLFCKQEYLRLVFSSARHC